MKNYDNTFNIVFGEYFTGIRKSRGMTRRYVANYLQINEATLLAYEFGTRSCPLSVFKQLCQFYQLDYVQTFHELDIITTARENHQ